jgi:hypothetical protein
LICIALLGGSLAGLGVPEQTRAWAADDGVDELQAAGM